MMIVKLTFFFTLINFISADFRLAHLDYDYSILLIYTKEVPVKVITKRFKSA